MSEASYIVTSFVKDDKCDVATYYTKLLLEHVLFSITYNQLGAANKEMHLDAFDYYVNNGLYYSAGDAAILGDFTTTQMREVQVRVLSWLNASRELFKEDIAVLEYFINDYTVGVRYEC